MSSSPYVGETDGSHINIDEEDDDLEEMPHPGEPTTTKKKCLAKEGLLQRCGTILIFYQSNQIRRRDANANIVE